MDEHIVEGYFFEDIRMANKAKKEYFNINKLKNSVSPDDLMGMKKLYLKLIDKKYFTTPVGFSFMQDLRGYLVENLGEDDLPLINVPSNQVIKAPEKLSEKYPGVAVEKYDELKKDYSKLEQTKNKLQIVILAFAVLVVGMFIIVVKNDNIGYFNAEEKVLNKYAAWEERLETWEAELKEREEELNGYNY
ncbi:MAG: hypothetical protein IJV15_05895 [Lachnospiraceae bacterium]|nr:hypothetical protein [Lachnospiraceae bacterium]